MPNNRIFYAVYQGGIKPDGFTGAYTEIHGLQSFGKTTNLGVTPVQEIGQLTPYQLIEEIPEVEITLNKVLDGYPLMYHLATKNAPSPTLVGRSAEKCIFAASFFPDTQDNAEGSPNDIFESSGLFVSSLSYTFPLEDNATEDLTLVGNDVIWSNDSKILNSTAAARSAALDFDGMFTTGLDAPIGVGGVSRRQHVRFDYNGALGLDTVGSVADPDATILPQEIQGISSSGTNDLVAGQFGAHINSISVSVDLGREAINELGRKAPYTRFAQFPTEVTTEVEVTATRGDLISATENGILGTGTGICDRLGDNTRNRSIRIATCEGTRIYMGPKNRLASTNMTGGDTGGGNMTVSYSFTTYSRMTVMHSGDPNPSGAAWWASRATYLVN